MDPVFFETAKEFRDWLEKHHESAEELWVGFRRRSTGLPSMTWEESVEEALCFGWIDGLRRSRDETSYVIRFTPRRPASAWSAVNVRKIDELISADRMRPAGLKAWETRHQSKKYNYTYTSPDRQLGKEELAEFKKHKKAWAFFEQQAPSYQRSVSHWVVSAKREETRARRLAKVIEESAEGRRLV